LRETLEVNAHRLTQQHVLEEREWLGRLTPTDLRALLPLKWQHVNPYGTFALYMNECAVEVWRVSILRFVCWWWAYLSANSSLIALSPICVVQHDAFDIRYFRKLQCYSQK